MSNMMTKEQIVATWDTINDDLLSIDDRIQAALVSSLVHAREHDDPTLFDIPVNLTSSRMMNSKALRLWIAEFAPVTIGKDDDGRFKVRLNSAAKAVFGDDRKSLFDVEGAESAHWSTFKPTRKARAVKPYTLEHFEDMLKGLVANEHGKAWDVQEDVQELARDMLKDYFSE